MALGLMRSSAVVAAGLALILAGAGAGAAWGQQMKVWDLPLGTHVSGLPVKQFVDPACGTNGGPPALSIGRFTEFERCPAEASGLREIWFIYDDEQELIARALRDPALVARHSATTVLGQPAIFSLLIDSGGLMQGYRVFTDPHAEEKVRIDAYRVGTAFMGLFGKEGWECIDLPPVAGQTPIGLTFVKQRCLKLSDGRQIVVESRHYYKPGQAYLDPRTRQVMVNAFESSARLEVFRVAAVRQ